MSTRRPSRSPALRLSASPVPAVVPPRGSRPAADPLAGRGWTRAAAATLGWLLAAGLGCVLSSNPERDEQDLCEYARCSTNATCEAGACTCEPDYIGDPYALDGCQPTAPAIIDSCVGAEDCGAGATCVEGRCACEAEAVGTCGDRTCVPLTSLCDDQADCASGYDEEPNVCRPTALLDWLLTDSCDDGLDVEFRLWAQDREWVWPGGDEVYETPGVSVDALQRIACAEGELVCFGGRAGAVEWGLGLDGQGDCSECCTPCTDGVFDLGFLTCG